MGKGDEAAFPPMRPLEGWGDADRGLTKREYFAALAMQAVALETFERGRIRGQTVEDAASVAAQLATVLADALMTELWPNAPR